MEWNIIAKIAVYGAVLSTVNLFWTIYRGLLDRSRIRVEVSQGLVANGTQHERDVQLLITVVNRGQRPVTLVNGGIKLKDGRDIVPTRGGFPIELGEGKAHRIYFPKHEITREFDPEYAWFRDATSKVYKSKKRELRRYIL